MFSKNGLVTARLRLVPVTPAHVRAFYNGRDELARLLDATIPASWPVDPIILEILKTRINDTAAFEWAEFFYIHKQDNRIIGDGGFKGPPDSDGRLEMGYGIIPEYRNAGLATEAAHALVDYAFSFQEVNAVCADTAVTGLASMRILEKAGMHKCGARHDDEDGDCYCWQILRSEYRKNGQAFMSER
jgi:RimJ/RimL family protein N-acetyltransferase